MKRIFQIVLLLAIVASGYWLYEIIQAPLRFTEEKDARSAEVIQRLKDIRTAQRAYKTTYGKYTPSMDTLINFIKNDSMVFMKQIGSEDDSVAVAQGKIQRIKFKVAVKDTIFKPGFNADELRIIPFSGGQEFLMAADTLRTESKITIPVFEARAPFKAFLGDLDHQELVNLIDYQEKTLGKYAGLKVGSITESTNDAGNWE